MTDTKPSEAKELLELKVKKSATTPAPGAPGHSLQDRVEDVYSSRDAEASHTTGAAEAAGVLTAVDEDEDDEEASAPRDFDYYSEGGEE